MELSDISTSSQYISFLIGIYAYLKLDMHKYLKIFLLVITVGTIAEIVNPTIRSLGLPNGISMNIYTFLNCLVFIFFLKKSLQFPRFGFGLFSLLLFLEVVFLHTYTKILIN